MSFEILLCCAIALYALLNFVILSRLTAAWNASRLVSKVAKAGTLAAVQFARDVSLIASIFYLCFALLALTLRFGYFGSVDFLKWAVTSASSLHESFEKISDFCDHWFFLFPVVLLIYLQWNRQKRDYALQFDRYIDEEMDRLNEERRKEPKKWDQIEADERIQNLDEQIASAGATLQALLQNKSTNKAERRKLLRQIIVLKEERAERDYQRRINFDRVNVQQSDSDHQSAWRRVLASKGLFSDLKGISKILSRVTLALLTVALIGVAGNAGLSKEFHERAIYLDELRVEARIDEANQSWAKLPRPSQLNAQDQTDNQTIHQLTYDFGRAFARNPNWQVFRASAHSERIYDHAIARRAILTEVRLPDAQGRSFEAFTSGFNANETEILKAAIHTPGTQSTSSASSRIGLIVEEHHGSEIKSLFGEKWASIQGAIHHHMQSYHEPVSIDDLQGELIDRIVGAAFDATEPHGISDVFKQARDGMSDTTKEAVREAVETEFKSFVNDLHEGKSYDASLEKIRKYDIPISKGRVEELAVLMHDHNLPDRRDFDGRAMADTGEWKGPDLPNQPNGTSSPSDITGRTETSSEAGSIIENIAKTTTSDGARSLQEEQVGALAEYEDHFPRSVVSQSTTPMGKVLARYRIAEDAPAFARVAELNVTRASSFTMLRGFSKVGGVLIGREPMGKADIRDIRWTIRDREVKLGLVDAKGKESWFGPFDISIVHQSLAYAADGRPVAVTMTFARPVRGLKIFLHPSLLDTPLGCRVEQLDRLVDKYTDRQLPERDNISAQYSNQVAVYNVALAKRMEAVAEKLPPSSSFKREAEQLAEYYGPVAEKGLKEPDLFSENGIIHRKPEFFEPSLIKTLKSCRKDGLTAFESCVLETYRDSRFVREFKQDYLRTWSYEPVSFEPWSGVRERDYQISSDLGFMRSPEATTVANRLWPFNFMVQIAFTSPAVNLPEKQQQVYVDRQPIEFTQIQDKIENLVNDGIHHDNFNSQFNDLRDFAVLQRLFRAALNGNLGDDFPTLKLAQLTKDSADATPYFHTRRWNSSSRLTFEHWAQQAFQARDYGQHWVKEARAKLSRCVARVSTAYQGGDSSEISSVCDFSEYTRQAAEACPDLRQNSSACSWRKAMIFARIEVTEAAFGVLDDEAKSLPFEDCPSLIPAAQATARR